MKLPGQNLFFNQKIIALISLVLFSFLLVGALRMIGLYEGMEEGKKKVTIPIVIDENKSSSEKVNIPELTPSLSVNK
jgi:hypothetical protein